MTVSKIVLNVVHFVISIYSLLCDVLEQLRSYLFVGSRSGVSLKTDGKSLPRLPIHLGVILVEEDFSFSDLAKITVWCIVLGISHISIYDRQGTVKINKDIFYKELQDYRKKISPDCSVENTNVNLQSGNNQLEKSETLPRNEINIRLLSMEDGRQHLVELTREISHAIKTQTMKLSEIEPVTIDNILQEKVGVPDPDMVIRFGQTESVMGFLPWQIRLTEFLSLPSHRCLEYSTFHSLLESYARTKQRFGK